MEKERTGETRSFIVRIIKYTKTIRRKNYEASLVVKLLQLLTFGLSYF
jgi:hypothetical protein